MAVEPKDVQNIVKAVVDALTQKHDPLVELIKNIVWPIVITLGFFFGLRKPLAQFLEGVGRRATKFSILPVSFEFESAKTQQFSLSNFFPFPGEDLTGGGWTDTTIMMFVNRIQNETLQSHLLVDIGTGRRWLISRLFLFTFILQRMGVLRCVVFVETGDEYLRRLLGIADPEMVCKVLGERYPWFQEALQEAWYRTGHDEHNNPIPVQQQEQIPIVTTLLPSTSARTLIDNFIRNRLLARTTPPAPPHGNRVEWEEFRPNQWEHTKWLNRRRVDEDLRSVFYDDDSSRFVDSLETSTHDRNKALLRRQAPFVALVNGKEELKGLVDRHVFLNQLAIYLAREAENQMP